MTEAVNTPPVVPYPTPRFPAWVQTTANAYNKAPSSQAFVEDCHISSTMIGVALQPYGDSNGDFFKATRTSVAACMIAFGFFNSQGRNVDFSNCTVDGCHTVFDNCSYGNHIGCAAGHLSQHQYARVLSDLQLRVRHWRSRPCDRTVWREQLPAEHVFGGNYV